MCIRDSLDAVRENSGHSVDAVNLSEIALHSFEKSAIKIWKIANLGVGHIWRGVYPLPGGWPPQWPLSIIGFWTLAHTVFEWWGSAPHWWRYGGLKMGVFGLKCMHACMHACMYAHYAHRAIDDLTRTCLRSSITPYICNTTQRKRVKTTINVRLK